MPDITNLATNTTFNAKINEVKGEIPRITNLASNVSLNTKINEVKGKIPNITNLATATAVATVENNTKISEIENKIATDHNHKKYITTQEFNKLTENFNARLKKANLASKNDISKVIKKIDFDKKLKNVTSSKNELNELLKLASAIFYQIFIFHQMIALQKI